MRTRRSQEHEAAVSRRLAQLGEELSAHRGGVRPARPEPPVTDPTTAPWWDEHTRPAAPRRHPPPTSPPALPGPAAAPVPPPLGPGRHAGPRLRWPGGFAPVHLAVVAVVVAVGLAVTCWWLVHGSAHPVSALESAPARGLVSAAPEPAAVSSVGAVGDVAAEPASTAAPPTVTVDVAGKVRHPGIAVLDAGARVVDALQAAGGARAGVDLAGLNLARVLIDGEQVVVGGAAPSGVAANAASAPGASSAPLTLVNLNTATESQLDTLPEVGPVTATSILAWRDQHGGFSSVDELLEVDGIGEVTLGKLAPYVTV